MRPVNATRIGLLFLVLATGCGESCACGKGGGTAHEQAAQTSSGGRGWPAPKPGSATGAAGSDEAPNPSWRPAPDSETTRQLAAAKAALERDERYDKLTDSATLAAVLGEKLGSLPAEGAASTTQREGADAKLVVVTRNYKEGGKSARVKITDTGLLPNARRVVSNRLTLIGNPAAGAERGLFVRGYPAVAAHFDDGHVSRASVVLANRYLIQVLVNDASDPDEAVRLLEQLDWTKLAPARGQLPAK